MIFTVNIIWKGIIKILQLNGSEEDQRTERYSYRGPSQEHFIQENIELVGRVSIAEETKISIM